MKKRMVEIYDTTLRDGNQDLRVSLTVHDKLELAKIISGLGIPYIEGGWPESNPTDKKFFQAVKNLNLPSQIVAFGSTCHAQKKPAEDNNIKTLLSAETQIVTIYGKSWVLHVEKVLKTTSQENLRIINDSVKYLRSQNRKVFYDAEHFFDGYKDNPDYALKTILTAQEAGAECIILCDTNGGSLPWEIEKIVKEVKKHLQVPFGIHCHNDSGLAVNNSLEAVKLGASQVQGTFNGYGERCGNANLTTLIPNLQLKMGILCIPQDTLPRLYATARLIAEITSVRLSANQPYVGENAFSHKGGAHQDGVTKSPASFEHVPPELVGNQRSFPVSDQTGSALVVLVLNQAEKFGQLNKKDPFVKVVTEAIKERTTNGYDYNLAPASLILLARRLKLGYQPPFTLSRFEVRVDGINSGSKLKEIVEGKMTVRSEAIIGLQMVGLKETKYEVAEGRYGPVHALDLAFRKALEPEFPILKKVKLVDYRVKVLPGRQGTAAKVSVLIESANFSGKNWRTVGVSENILLASVIALLESYEFALWQTEGEKR